MNDCALSADEFDLLFVQSGIARLFEESNPAVASGMSDPDEAMLAPAIGSTAVLSSTRQNI